jgi:hypothetical protein
MLKGVGRLVRTDKELAWQLMVGMLGRVKGGSLVCEPQEAWRSVDTGVLAFG